MSAPKAVPTPHPCNTPHPPRPAPWRHLMWLSLWLASLLAISAKPPEEPPIPRQIARTLQQERLRASNAPLKAERNTRAATNPAHLAFWQAQEHMRQGESDAAITHYGQALGHDPRYIHDPTLARDLIEALLAGSPETSPKVAQLLAAYPSSGLRQRLTHLAYHHPEARARHLAWQAMAWTPEKDSTPDIEMLLLSLEHASSCPQLSVLSQRIAQQPRSPPIERALRELRHQRPRHCRARAPASFGACLPCWQRHLDATLQGHHPPAPARSAAGERDLDTPKVQD